MRFLAIILAFVSGISFAQSYRIITCSEGITVAGNTVTPGMIIEHSSEKINIPTGGYVGLITNEGDIGTLHSPTPLDNLGRLMRREKLMSTGALHDDRPVVLPLIPANSNDEIMGDSLFAYWHFQSELREQPRVVEIINAHGDLLLSLPYKDQWTIFGISDWRATEQSVIIQLKGSKKILSGSMMSVRIGASKRDLIIKQLEPFSADPDKLFYECAVYELNGLYYDRSMAIYRIMSCNQVAGDSFLKSYFDRLNRETMLRVVKID